MVGASPRCAEESAGGSIGERCARWQRGFKRLQRDADLVAHRFEPRLRARLAGFEHVLAHENLGPPLGHARLCVTIAHASERARKCSLRDSFELFFAILWAGENSSRSFFLPFFRETLSVWGMLGVCCPPPVAWGPGRRWATKRQRAMRVRGSALGVRMSLTRFVFF